MKIKVFSPVLMAAIVLLFASTLQVQASPDAIVRSLYAAKSNGPFFQDKSRARVDKYFTKDFADLIWRDRKEAGNEVGYIDFDPLYAAQDVHIKGFKIGGPVYGEGNRQVADVPVTFRNMGNAQTVLFTVTQTKGVWKISDIHYTPGLPSLKGHLKEFLK